MKSEQKEVRKDVSYVAAGIVLLFLLIFPNGPFGFLPPSIAVFIAFLVSYFWFAKYFESLDEIIKKRGRIIEISSLSLLIFFWFLLKVFCIHYSTTDENIYFYMAKRFSEGLLPYKDFFFAHPPMHLIIPAVIFKIFGFNIVIAKLIPITASLISGLFLYRLLRSISGVVTAFAGLIYYLFSYQVLMASSDMTGINLTIMFLSVSVYYLFLNKPVISGIFSGLAVSTGMYSAGLIATVVIYLLILREFRQLLRYLASFIVLVLIVFGTFYIIGGENFILGVFRYHTLKPEKIEGRVDIFNTVNPFVIMYGIFANSLNFLMGREFLKSLYFHSMLYIPFLIAVVSFLVLGIKDFIKRKELKRPPFYRIYRLIGFALLSFVFFVAEYSSLRELYDFYLIFLFYFMSIGAAYVIRYLTNLPSASKLGNAAIITFALIISLWMYKPLSESMDRPLFGQDVRKDGERIEYTYKEPQFAGFISDLAHLLYFKDYRIAGKTEPFYRHYIWNKNLSFEKAKEMADYIRANTKEFETITGASTIAPLLALLSDRRISSEEIDTNAKRFKSGILSDEDFFRKVCSDNLKYLVITARSYFSERYIGHSDFLRNSFVQDKKFTDPSAQHFRPLEIYLFKPVFAGCGLVK